VNDSKELGVNHEGTTMIGIRTPVVTNVISKSMMQNQRQLQDLHSSTTKKAIDLNLKKTTISSHHIDNITGSNQLTQLGSSRMHRFISNSMANVPEVPKVNASVIERPKEHVSILESIFPVESKLLPQEDLSISAATISSIQNLFADL
jgi:hypothetical protein